MPNDRQRRQVAAEAARLLLTHAETDYLQAKTRAARQLCLGPVRPDDLPSNAEVLAYAEALADGGAAALEPLLQANAASFDRFHFYQLLLLPLEQVMQNPDTHPEGDALYHSLQVFELARERIPYDEDFLLAALLHDIGKGIDARDHIAAGIAALGDFISERTAWLIEHHSDANALKRGTLGQRARRRLEENESFEELMVLGECDRAGRQCGMLVPDVVEALRYVRELDETDGE